MILDQKRFHPRCSKSSLLVNGNHLRLKQEGIQRCGLYAHLVSACLYWLIAMLTNCPFSEIQMDSQEKTVHVWCRFECLFWNVVDTCYLKWVLRLHSDCLIEQTRSSELPSTQHSDLIFVHLSSRDLNKHSLIHDRSRYRWGSRSNRSRSSRSKSRKRWLLKLLARPQPHLEHGLFVLRFWQEVTVLQMTQLEKFNWIWFITWQNWRQNWVTSF